MKHLIIIIFSVLLIGCGKNNTNDVTKLEGAPAPFDGSKKLHFALILVYNRLIYFIKGHQFADNPFHIRKINRIRAV